MWPFLVRGFRLELSVEGNGSVSVDPDLDQYAFADLVNIQAQPDVGWYHSHWDFDGRRVDPVPLAPAMTEDLALTAVFLENDQAELRFVAGAALASSTVKSAGRLQVEDFYVENVGGREASARVAFFLTRDSVMPATSQNGLDELDVTVGPGERLSLDDARLYLYERIRRRHYSDPPSLPLRRKGVYLALLSGITQGRQYLAWVDEALELLAVAKDEVSTPEVSADPA